MYQAGQKAKPINEEAMKILEKYRVNPPAPLVDEDSQMRLVGRFVNEAVLCLQESVLENPVNNLQLLFINLLLLIIFNLLIFYSKNTLFFLFSL